MKKYFVISAAALTLALAGCASTPAPTFGQTAMKHSDEARKVGKIWNQGETLVKKADKADANIASKKKQIEKLQKDIIELTADSNEWRTKGTALKQDAESRGSALRATVAKEAATEAAAAQEAAKAAQAAAEAAAAAAANN